MQENVDRFLKQERFAVDKLDYKYEFTLNVNFDKKWTLECAHILPEFTNIVLYSVFTYNFLFLQHVIIYNFDNNLSIIFRGIY